MSAVLRAVDTLADKREPPYSSEAEHSVLGGLLLDNSRWHDAATLLTAADFYHHEHGAIFAAITAIIGSGAPADVITVYQHLQVRGQARESLIYSGSPQ